MKRVIRYLKIALGVFFVVFVFLQVRQPKASEADFNTVFESIQAKMEDYNLVEQDNKSIKKYLNVNPDDYESMVYYKSNDPMNVHEFVLVKFKDTVQSTLFNDAIQARIDAQINAFDGYGAEQVALLKEAVVSIDSNFALYITSENANDIKQLYKDQL